MFLDIFDILICFNLCLPKNKQELAVEDGTLPLLGSLSDTELDQGREQLVVSIAVARQCERCQRCNTKVPSCNTYYLKKRSIGCFEARIDKDGGHVLSLIRRKGREAVSVMALVCMADHDVFNAKSNY